MDAKMYGQDFIENYDKLVSSDGYNKEVSAEVLSAGVMDSNVSLYGSFERIAQDYRGGSEETRKAIDAVVSELTGSSLAEILEGIQKELANREADKEL